MLANGVELSYSRIVLRLLQGRERFLYLILKKQSAFFSVRRLKIITEDQSTNYFYTIYKRQHLFIISVYTDQ
jgi:hypothetical protein